MNYFVCLGHLLHFREEFTQNKRYKLENYRNESKSFGGGGVSFLVLRKFRTPFRNLGRSF